MPVDEHKNVKSQREAERFTPPLLLKQKVVGRYHRCRRRRGQVVERGLVRARRILHHGDETTEFVEAKRRGVVARTDQLKRTVRNAAIPDVRRTSARPRDLIC